MPATMNRKHYYIFAGILLALIIAFFFASPAHAQSADATQKVDSLLTLIQNQAHNWSAKLVQYAQSLFWSLALIQFIWTFFPLAIRNADFGEIVGELIKFILIIGFFFFLLTDSTSLAQAVIDSFREAAGNAAGTGGKLEPGSMFGVAIDMALTVMEGGASATPTAGDWFSDPVAAASDALLSPFAQLGAVLAAILIGICFAFIAAFMFVTLVESYIVINAAVLFMGFGGSQWTREYALAMVRYAMSVGAKLFVLTLLVGLVLQSTKQWQAAYTDDNASMLTMVGLALVCAYLSKQIPDLVQGLITGTSLGGGAALGSMASMAIGAAAGGAAGAAAMAGGSAGGAAAAAGGAAPAGGSTGLASALANSISAGPPAGAAPGGVASAAGAAANPVNSLTPRIGGGASAAPSSGPSSGGEGSAVAPSKGGAQQSGSDAGGATGSGDGGESSAADYGAFEETAMSEADAMAASPDTGGEAPTAPTSDNAGPAANAPQGSSSTSAGANGEGQATATPESRSKVATGAEKMAKAAHIIASGAGMLGAISVPGMEGAAAGAGPGPRLGMGGGKPPEGEFKTKPADTSPASSPPPSTSAASKAPPPAPKKGDRS